jgi:WD40 repeat protein
MPDIRLVNQVCFYDKENLLITSGIKGKYNPKLAAQVDPKGRYIGIDLI